jgi:hypothetical protein
MAKKIKRPTDVNQRAKNIVDIATGEAEDIPVPAGEKNPAAVALGRLGGLKGGAARAKSLTPKRRAEIAKKAAAKRWGNKKDKK